MADYQWHVIRRKPPCDWSSPQAIDVNLVAHYVLIGFVALLAWIPSTAVGAGSAEALFKQGKWEEASEEALLRDDPASLRMRSRFSLWAGDDEDALHFAQVALQASSSGEQRQKSTAQLARLKWWLGERDESIEQLRNGLRDAPNDLEIRFELGWRLVDEGKLDEGRSILEGAVRRYNDGLITEVEDFVWVGRSMQAADRPRDANRALSRALNDDEEHMEANLHFAQLMLSHYNTAEAEAAFQRVLERYDGHPEALVGMAAIEFYQSGRFATSMELVTKAQEHYPGHPAVQRSRAELLIAQGAWEEGRAVAQKLLDRSPHDGDALALLAAAENLLGDTQAFEAAQQRFDERRQSRPELLARVAEFAAKNNRHRASIPLFEQALERDDGYGPALTGLGMALTRTGEEVRGIDVLKQAFAVDRYQVPVYNKLELYDRGLREYVTDDVDGFRLRAHESQFELIRDIAEPFVAEARREFDERYGVELPDLTLEVFADSEAFSVRSIGLPHVDPHGICFGRVVLSRGPGSGDFNWPMVLWHELAHSYHLELSQERVPVWFTEGLAEYETRRHDATWTRFHDLDLARRVKFGHGWSIAEMDQAFMTGGRLDIGHAYQWAMLIMEFLDERHGFETIVEMLQGFSQMPRADRVFEATLEQSIDEIDRDFEAWLREKYSSLLRQELVDWMRLHAMLSDEAVDHATDGEGSAYRAMVAAVRNDDESAQMHLASAQRRGDEEPAVKVLTVLVFDVLDEIDEGLKAGRGALQAGIDGFDLRYAMSRMAERADRREEAFVHALAATMLAPDEAQGWQQLGPRARAVGAEGWSRRAATELFYRNAHSASLARQRFNLFEGFGNYDGAYGAARRWTEVAPLDARSQLALARVAVRRGEWEKGTRAWDRAVLSSPARRDEIWQMAAGEFRRAGAADLARTYEQRIEDEAARSP